MWYDECSSSERSTLSFNHSTYFALLRALILLPNSHMNPFSVVLKKTQNGQIIINKPANQPTKYRHTRGQANQQTNGNNNNDNNNEEAKWWRIRRTACCWTVPDWTEMIFCVLCVLSVVHSSSQHAVECNNLKCILIQLSKQDLVC